MPGMFRRRSKTGGPSTSRIDPIEEVPEHLERPQDCNPQEDGSGNNNQQLKLQQLQQQHRGILRKGEKNSRRAARRSSLSSVSSNGSLCNGSNHSNEPKSSRARRRRASLSTAMPLPTDVKKRVSWNRRVEKKRHIRIQDLTPEEIESVWYNEDDSKLILAMAKVTVKMMMRGEPCDDEVDFCSRGLEGKTSAGSKRRQRNKACVRRALLEEQQMQRDEGVFDPDFLAQVCLRYSRDNMAAAHAQGKLDEREVQHYLFTSNGDSSPMPPARKVNS